MLPGISFGLTLVCNIKDAVQQAINSVGTDSAIDIPLFMIRQSIMTTDRWGKSHWLFLNYGTF